MTTFDEDITELCALTAQCTTLLMNYAASTKQKETLAEAIKVLHQIAPQPLQSFFN